MGRLVVISAPSGSGKTTVIKVLRKAQPRLVRSVSMTTRSPRPGERDGRDYLFVSPEEFQRLRRRGAFLECARILGYWYGTPLAPVRKALRAGKDVLLGVDIQGARQVRRLGLPAITIFLLPPSFEVLRQRLKGRGTETQAQIRDRLQLARRELREVKRFDYAVVNDTLEEAVREIRTILLAQRCRSR